MSFASSKYDVENYQRDLFATIGAGHYQTNLPRNACDGCFSPETRNSTHGNSIYENSLVDVDSELMGLNVKNSKCPTKQYDPVKSNEKFVEQGKTHYDDCKVFTAENTLLSNPPCTLRGTGWNRWEWLCQNPQDRAIVPFNRGLDIGANTNLMARDNHRPCMPEPVKQSLSHPSKKNMKNVDPNVVMFYDPLSKYPVYNNVDQYQVATEQNWKNCTQI